MQLDVSTSSIAHVIQLAIAPVFLLTGIASFLGVLTNRLGRIIDRARMLEGHFPSVTGEHRAAIGTDLRMLSRRATHVNRAISLFTTSALLVCMMIALLFISQIFSTAVSQIISALFVLSMLALIVGLVSFLREVHLATQSLRIGPH